VQKGARFTHLTFDCYGTLIDWRAGIERELVGALGGIRISGQQRLAAYVEAEKSQESEYRKYREVLRRTIISLSGPLGMTIPDTAAQEFAGSVPEWPAFPDTAEALRSLGKKGYKRFILSNVDTDLLKETISHSGLSVDSYVTAEECKSYKPALGHWKSFMERTGAKKEEILHVAQSVYHDILPTGKLGIASAWVNRYGQPLPRDAAPLYICDSLASLVALVE